MIKYSLLQCRAQNRKSHIESYESSLKGSLVPGLWKSAEELGNSSLEEIDETCLDGSVVCLKIRLLHISSHPIAAGGHSSYLN